MDSPVRPVSTLPRSSTGTAIPAVPPFDKAKLDQQVAKINKLSGPIGLEKVILLAQIGARKFQRGLDEVLYGKIEYNPKKDKIPIKTNPLSIGVSNILDEILLVDYCNLINYYLLNSKIGKSTFNPKNPPEDNATWQQKQVFKLKKLAYDIQSIIEGGEEYAAERDLTSANDTLIEDETLNEEEKKKKVLFEKIKFIRKKFDELKKVISPETKELSNILGNANYASSTDIIGIFPGLKKILPSVEDKVQYLNKFTDYRQIPISDYQKLLNTLDKIKLSAILIQGFSTPADLLAILPKNLSKPALDQLAKVSKIINPAKAIPFIRNLISTLNKINLIIGQILKIITFVTGIITVVLLFIKIMKKLLVFFNVNPAPTMFLTLGVVSVSEDGKNKVKETTSKFEDRLSQIAYLLQIMFQICTTIALEISDLIRKLRILLVNIQQCENVENEVIVALTAEIEKLEENLKAVNKFVDNKNNNTKNSDLTRIGEYTIQIVTEQVVEESISIRRRYGIALNNRKSIVVSSTPTFASLDSIIIAEVKQLLSAKGLIKSSPSSYSITEEALINDVKSYLLDDDINMDINYGDPNNPGADFQLDPPDNENDDIGIGLNSFINKLQGGKALRKRVRNARIKNNEDLVKSLKADDPDGKYSSGIINKTEKENERLKAQKEIDRLQIEKKKYLAIVAASPILAAKSLALKKIKEIDKEIKKLRKITGVILNVNL